MTIYHKSEPSETHFWNDYEPKIQISQNLLLLQYTMLLMIKWGHKNGSFHHSYVVGK